jgi:hypothetical protein
LRKACVLTLGPGLLVVLYWYIAQGSRLELNENVFLAALVLQFIGALLGNVYCILDVRQATREEADSPVDSEVEGKFK